MEIRTWDRSGGVAKGRQFPQKVDWSLNNNKWANVAAQKPNKLKMPMMIWRQGTQPRAVNH
jgi:hypothetical protein